MDGRAGPGLQAPYFAMEFIDGRHLTGYAAAHDLSDRDRLDLFARVCDAVQHAHQKGVIHRDLKPGNILVVEGNRDEGTGTAGEGTEGTGTRGRRRAHTSAADSYSPSAPVPSVPVPFVPAPSVPSPPQPKIIDFGIARATGADLAAATVHTGPGEMIGTPAYMSPEQCGRDPGGAGGAGSGRGGGGVDVRSDVYSLGVVLYELLSGRLPYDVIGLPLSDATRIIRERPPRRLGTEHARLRGDVETIVGKALEKDPARRYQSVAEFAADLRRHLDDRPIEARPPGTFYQIRKFARRQKGLVGGAAAAVLMLALGAAGTTWGMLRAWDAEGVAKEQFGIAQDALNDQARLLAMLGRHEEAVGLFEQVLQESRARLGPEHRGTLATMSNNAAILTELGEFDRALPLRLEVLRIQTRVLGEDHPDTLLSLGNLGGLYVAMGRPAEAVPVLERARALLERALGEGDETVLAAICNLGGAYAALDRLDEGARTLAVGVERLRRAEPVDRVTLGNTLNNLGYVLTKLGRYTEAERTLLESHGLFADLLGSTDPRLAGVTDSLATLYGAWGRPERAAAWGGGEGGGRAGAEATAADASAGPGR